MSIFWIQSPPEDDLCVVDFHVEVEVYAPASFLLFEERK